MEINKRECDAKTQCKFCQKLLVKRYMKSHIERMHSNEPNFEVKSLIADCLDKFDDYFLNYLYVKEKVSEINNSINESILNDPLFIEFDKHIQYLVGMNLATVEYEQIDDA